MSNPLRIALVGEGTTEREVIEAALKSILAPRSFVLNQLQPEATKPDMGTGWGGVLKWCQQQAARCKPNGGSIDDDPTLSTFDGVILQIDADVANFSYANLRPPYTNAEAAANNWHPLPCLTQCPPAPIPNDDVQKVLLSWLHPAVFGNKTVVCIPSMNMGTWMAAAKLPANHAYLTGLECNPNIENLMEQVTLKFRIKKGDRKSRIAAANAVATRWKDVTFLCTRALAFEQAILIAFP
ncbi:hypothetical protein DR66_3864 [Delftia acidovorans]|uniref:hypothetical protein n=1 Tax=Delftia acidovorans TaxID=80866 RepID=UPI00050099E7|nr:hypothetical protein [Delftia acidovorans]KFJ12895.1 hypothetical protein DR66_3864 [Delftia acidovorans]QQB53214.1 hypothetical protein I6H54_13600 [Delftia acidovorans]